MGTDVDVTYEAVQAPTTQVDPSAATSAKNINPTAAVDPTATSGPPKRSYIYSFTLEFAYDSDIVYLAYAQPYTYSQQQLLTQSLLDDEKNSNTFYVRELCRTAAGNRVDLLTITEQWDEQMVRSRSKVDLTTRIKDKKKKYHHSELSHPTSSHHPTHHHHRHSPTDVSSPILSNSPLPMSAPSAVDPAMAPAAAVDSYPSATSTAGPSPAPDSVSSAGEGREEPPPMFLVKMQAQLQAVAYAAGATAKRTTTGAATSNHPNPASTTTNSGAVSGGVDPNQIKHQTLKKVMM